LDLAGQLIGRFYPGIFNYVPLVRFLVRIKNQPGGTAGGIWRCACRGLLAVADLGSKYLFDNVSRHSFFILLGSAGLVAGIAALFLLPPAQNQVISSQIQPDQTLPPTLRLLWFGFRLSDFASLAGLLVYVEGVAWTIVRQWSLFRRTFLRLLAVFFPLGIVLIGGVIANLAVSAASPVSSFNQLPRLSSKSLIALDQGSNTFLRNIRVYTILFENYPGWVMVAPAKLVGHLGLNSMGKLTRWGRIGSLVTADYSPVLTAGEMNDLLALKNVVVDNGEGLHYIVVLENDPNRKICLRTYKKTVFVVPVSFSPICESK
jgi:hypothetical protein